MLLPELKLKQQDKASNSFAVRFYIDIGPLYYNCQF